MDIIQKRDQMALTDGLTYLNHASVGPLPKESLKTINKENLVQAEVGERKIDYEAIDKLWGELRDRIANLLRGKKDGVTITTNTASGLHVVADTIQSNITTKSNFVIPESEFVTNSYCWQQLANRYHIELRTVPLSGKDQIISLENWEKQIDDNTVLVAVSHVQFSTGFRSELQAISSIAHQHDSYMVVDAIQGLGVVPFDVQKSNVDFVAAAGYKWLLSPYGTGLLYCKPEILEDMESILVGWFSTPRYKTLIHNTFQPWKDARKFQQSMINPAYNAFSESLKLILEWEPQQTYNHVIGLLDHFIDEINDMNGFKVSSSLESEHRSGILSVICDKKIETLRDYLEKENITIAIREKGIRVSPHAYNSIEEIDKLLTALKTWYNL